MLTYSVQQRITLETRLVGDIPVLVSVPEAEGHCPLVFYVPGFMGKRSDGLGMAYQLAQAGMACISLDPLFHGSRYDERLVKAAEATYGGVYPAESGLDVFLTFMRVIEQSAHDIGTLINALSGNTRLDMSRVGVTGFSMGACVTFLAFATLPQIKAAVPMMGVPTFSRRWLDLLDECAWSNPNWAAALAQMTDKIREHSAFIERIDPARHLQQAAPRPLLLMNGDFDSDMMKTFALAWYRDAKTAWDSAPNHLRWVVYPVGHTVTPQMEQDAVAWFATHL